MTQANGQDGKPDLGRDERTLGGRQVALDREGFFLDFQDWSAESAAELARESAALELGPDHWKVIEFLREFYAYNARAPLNAQLKKGTGLSLLQLEELFPQGIKLGARRLAGLPNPKTCE